MTTSVILECVVLWWSWWQKPWWHNAWGWMCSCHPQRANVWGPVTGHVVPPLLHGFCATLLKFIEIRLIQENHAFVEFNSEYIWAHSFFLWILQKSKLVNCKLQWVLSYTILYCVLYLIARDYFCTWVDPAGCSLRSFSWGPFSWPQWYNCPLVFARRSKVGELQIKSI